MQLFDLHFQGYDPKNRSRKHLHRVVKAPHRRAVDLFLSYNNLKGVVTQVVEGGVADQPEYGKHWLADGVDCIINVRGAVIASLPGVKVSEWRQEGCRT